MKISVVVNYPTNFLLYKLFSVNHYKILLTYNVQSLWKRSDKSAVQLKPLDVIKKSKKTKYTQNFTSICHYKGHKELCNVKQSSPFT